VSPPAPDTEETEAELRRLHPAAEPGGIPDWVPIFAPETEFVLEEEPLREALRTAPQQSAGGWSQRLYEQLKDLCLEDDEKFALLLLICCLIAARRITERVAKTLATGRLLAMAKPEGGVRSIAVGKVLLRLVGRAIGRQQREQFQQALQPFQFGVATPGGCKAVVHGIRAHLDVFQNHVPGLQTDVENEFNFIYRSAIFSELRERMPQFGSFLPSDLRL
jgi:hypothetical protein